MDRLAQFVSKSFESNNNNPRTSSPGCLNLSSSDRSSPSPRAIPQSTVSISNPTNIISNYSSQESEQPTNVKRVAKNWLISDSPKRRCNSPFGMDLRVLNGTSNNSNHSPTPHYPVILPSNNNSGVKVAKNADDVKIIPERPRGDPSDPEGDPDDCESPAKQENLKSPLPSPKNSRCSSSSPAIDLEDSRGSVGDQTTICSSQNLDSRGRSPPGVASEDEKKPCK